MPCGHHIARCLHCGREWMVGDCIPVTCDECLDSGHSNGWSLDCRKCNESFDRIRAASVARLAEEARRKAAAEVAAEPDPDREFSEGIL